MKRLRFDVATDPYIVKLRKRVTHLENTGRLTEGWPRYGWEFEAKRRFFADAIPYYEDEATWGLARGNAGRARGCSNARFDGTLSA